MKSKVTEVARDVYRISTFRPYFRLQFNQFLVADDEPFLMHTAFKKMFPVTVEGVALRPRTIGLMHGSTFRGDGAQAILDLAAVIEDTLGNAGRDA